MNYVNESVLVKQSRVLKNGLIEGIKCTHDFQPLKYLAQLPLPALTPIEMSPFVREARRTITDILIRQVEHLM